MPTAEAIARLKAQLRTAFPAFIYDGEVTSCNCDECFDIRTALQGKRWTEVSGTFIDFTLSAALLTPAACCAFLPAYLIHALHDLEQKTNILEFMVYSLCLNSQDDAEAPSEYAIARLEAIAHTLTGEQRGIVRSFLELAAEANPEHFRAFVVPARNRFWSTTSEVTL